MKRVLFLCVCIGAALSARSQVLQSAGLVISGGKSEVSYHLPAALPSVSAPIDAEHSTFRGKLALEFGYRWRLNPFSSSRLFMDAEVLGGYTSYDYQWSHQPMGDEYYAGGEGDFSLLNVSASGHIGCYLYKGLYTAAGVQPMYYIWEKGFFDIPASFKLGYNLKCIEIGFSYRIGLTRNCTDIPVFRENRLSQWAVSLYVPLSKRK